MTAPRLRRHHLIRSGASAAALATLAGLVALPTTSYAADRTPPTTGAARLAFLQGRGNAEIGRRQTTLTADAARLADATSKLDADLAMLASKFPADANVAALKAKVDGDLSALGSLISADQSGLGQLKAKIDADTDVSTAHADVETIVTGFRIYVLVDPKIHLTIASDRELVAADLVTDIEPALSRAITTAQGKGKDVSGAQAAYNDLVSKAQAASAAAGPVAANVAGLQPSGYPGNAGQLKAALSAVQTAAQDLKSARRDVTTIRAELRD